MISSGSFINGCLKAAFIALLCLSTSVLSGFSKTLQSERDDAEKSAKAPLALQPSSPPITGVINRGANSNDTSYTDSTNAIKTSRQHSFTNFRVRKRPASLAGAASLDVSGTGRGSGIDSLLWINAREATRNSPAGTSRNSIPGVFRGVGFPQIRTHKQTRRSPFDPPGPWAPLVAWRDLQDTPNAVQPIAHVRCMGLSPQAVAKRADRYAEQIYSVAERYEVDPLLVKAVITQESCFNNQATSRVGALGLMQLMPDTASWLKVSDPQDPEQNLRGGVRYLASLQKQFETMELTLAAYNAGPGNVRRYDGVPPFEETRNYIQKVLSHHRRYLAAHSLLFPAVNKTAADEMVVDTMAKPVVEQLVDSLSAKR